MSESAAASRLSMYAMSKLGEKEFGVAVRPQMLYNYRKNGLLKAVGSDGMIGVDEARAWFEKYLSRRAARAAK